MYICKKIFNMEKQVILNDIKTDYSVTSEGLVYSNKFNRRIKVSFNNIKGGYKMCYIYANGNRIDILVHRIDGNKENNNVYNLEWVTQSENITHAYKNKLMKKSFKECWNSSLDENDVLQIRKMIFSKIKQRDIANKFNISEQIVSNIKLNKSYIGIGLIEKGLAMDINDLKK